MWIGEGGGGTGNLNACLWVRGRREDYEQDWGLWAIADIEESFRAVEAAYAVEAVPPSPAIGRRAAPGGTRPAPPKPLHDTAGASFAARFRCSESVPAPADAPHPLQGKYGRRTRRRPFRLASKRTGR